MSDSKLSSLAALPGADVAAGDLFYVDDVSVTTSKSIRADELAIAMKSVPATQAQQETATSAVVTVTPSTQQFHPSAPKAWGLVTPATTVTVSYPSAGTSVTNPATAKYVVTHGRTFSSSDYAINITAKSDGTNACAPTITAQDTTTFTVQFFAYNNTFFAPGYFSYACFGDLA